MENIYKNMGLEKIPWNMTQPPDLIKDFISDHIGENGSIIELGCGAGNYVIYFSERGYRTAGVDFCKTAIGFARDKAKKKGLDCSFFVADVVSDISVVHDMYDLIFDWELLHHIFPEHREKYLENVKCLLKQGGYYLSVCFSEDNKQFGGKGKYRKTPLDTELYFSSEDEMYNLFKKRFEIIHLSTEDIEGKFAPHRVIYAVLRSGQRATS